MTKADKLLAHIAKLTGVPRKPKRGKQRKIKPKPAWPPAHCSEKLEALFQEHGIK